MCLYLTKDSTRLRRNCRRRKNPIIVYKIVSQDYRTFHRGHQWPDRGKVKSDRECADLTAVEHRTEEVYRGLHFLVDNPAVCTPKHHMSEFCWRCGYCYVNKCPLEKPANYVLQCAVDPKDVVAVGMWCDHKSLVATKCTVLGVV